MIIHTNTRRVEPDITVVEIGGRLALGNALHSLETSVRRLIQEGARRLVIDLSGLSYIDSAAIGVLIGCNGEMSKAGGRMHVAGAQGAVADSFDVVHLRKVVALDSDVASACHAIAEGDAATV